MKKNRKSKKNRKKGKFEIVGNISIHRKGFAFLVPREDEICTKKWEHGDIFIKKSLISDAMDGDTVSVAVFPKELWKGSPEGEVKKIIERKHRKIVGIIDKSHKFAFCIPSDKKIREDVFIRSKNLNGARNGDVVEVEITSYKERDKKNEGRVIDIISKAGKAGGDIRGLIVQSGRKLDFSDDVAKRAKEMEKVGIEKKDEKNRRDLRKEIIFTIDGNDSKDFDDAVSIEKIEDTYSLKVHIADVAHYVKSGDSLDREAYNRGNSVYLINMVVPMLPKELSNNLCSLRPNEDKLALTCHMIFDKAGKMLKYEIYESIIRSKARLTYDEVASFLEGEGSSENITDEIGDKLRDMRELAEIFIKLRDRRGSIDFDTAEPQIYLDKTGKAIGVKREDRNFAHRLIEEFMLKANETVAEHIFWLQLPTMYRNHESPDEEKMRNINALLGGMGLKIKGDISSVKPYQIKDVIEGCRDTKYENIVSRALLKSMQKAEYSEVCRGHFGLALKYYCHFTSPIRRYSDLVVHRTLKAILKNEYDALKSEKYLAFCQKASKHCNDMEKSTLLLERDVEDMKLAEFISNHKGECFVGTVSGVTSHGIYVEILGCIDGRVALKDIEGDIYIYEEDKYRIRGVNTNKIYALGDEVKIRVYNADVENREIDFLLA